MCYQWGLKSEGKLHNLRTMYPVNQTMELKLFQRKIHKSEISNHPTLITACKKTGKVKKKGDVIMSKTTIDHLLANSSFYNSSDHFIPKRLLYG